MNKIFSHKYKESYIEETLENGLKVVIWQKPGFEKSYAAMATPVGAFDILQRVEGKKRSYHPGIAHFLEHKMFESKNGDVMDDFSKMGANVNAATSYNSTVYYFQTSGDLIEPLNLLLDFTQSFDISEESVEKEKGIIVQELNMYRQMSDFRLVRETFASLFQNHPLKYDVGGDEDSVMAVTLDELNRCYEGNYHPSKMICVVVSGKDSEEILKAIKNNQNKKSFCQPIKIERVLTEEPLEVVQKHTSFQMDVNKLKVNIAYKQKGIADPLQRYKNEISLRFLFDAYFSTLNENYQTWLDSEVINDFFGYEFDFGEDYGHIMVYSETEKEEEFKNLVSQQLQKIQKGTMSEDVFKQLKRRYFGENIKELNDFESVALQYISTCFNGCNVFDILNLAEEITLEDVKRAGASLDLTHSSVVECKPLHI